MNIQHIPSQDDFSYDVKLPLQFTDEDGREHRIESWSLDGILRPATLDHAPVSGALALTFQGFGVGVPVDLRPGLDPYRLDFVNMTNRQADLIKAFYRGIIGGRMETVDQVIRTMDMPVRKVPMTETAEDRANAPTPASRWLRAAVALGTYLALALLVFSSLGYAAWSRWNFVDMANARVVTGDGGLSVQGWLEDERIIETWIGMPAEVRLNVAGDVVTLAGEVTRMTAGREPGHRAEEGYLVAVRLLEPPAAAPHFAPDTPVDVILDRQLMARLARAARLAE